ncbi:MAG: TIGR03620 family F420-dependent LLM class oxidoreductase [Gammaproteobacteria bacterium]|nr:TIGR03620 family F420-dependent LLM class oxidoreductase [Gammaproteobacteria bacterium]
MSEDNRIGAIVSTEGMPAVQLVEFAQRLETLGYESLWLPELFGREPVATAGYLLGQTQRLQVATGIANVYVRDAHAMAQTRQTLAELSAGRFILGLGVSNVGLNTARGHTWQMPLPKMRSYLDALDAAAIDSPPPTEPAPLYIAAHGPRLQALGAERTDGIITYLMPPEHTAQSRARIGPGPALSVVCPFLAEPDAAIARQKARKALKYYVTLDYYHQEWSKLGFADADFADGGSDRLIDTLVAWGNEGALRDRLAAYRDAGANRVIVMPFDRLGQDGEDSLSLLATARG